VVAGLKIANPYRCDADGCGRAKESTNHWLLIFLEDDGAEVLRWDDFKAENGYENVDGTRRMPAHLCGIECAQKWLNRAMAKLVGQ
jgi:hypothetical protein